MVYKIKHTTYIDDCGIKRDSLECIKTELNGHRTVKPFWGKIKVLENVQSFNDATVLYTKEEYAEMLVEQSGF